MAAGTMDKDEEEGGNDGQQLFNPVSYTHLDVYKRQFMVSGPVMIQALEGEGAIAKNRDLMGATDPKKAAPGTIRADFADSIDANACLLYTSRCG